MVLEKKFNHDSPLDVSFMCQLALQTMKGYSDNSGQRPELEWSSVGS